jgi:hypothetical protein
VLYVQVYRLESDSYLEREVAVFLPVYRYICSCAFRVAVFVDYHDELERTL